MTSRHLALCSAALFALPALAEPPLAATPSRRIPVGVNRPMQASVSRLPISAQAGMAAELPPLPEGVEELKFADFYKMPVGPKGLEPSEKLLGMNGAQNFTGYFDNTEVFFKIFRLTGVR